MPVIGINNQANPLHELGSDKLQIAKGEGVSVGFTTEQTMLNVSGPGCVKSFWMALGGGNGPTLDGRIRVYYDGASTPAIDIDAGSLFATHFGAGSAGGTHSTHHMHVEINSVNDNTGFLMTFPMPFGNSIKVTYYNTSTVQTAAIYWMLTYSLYATDRANGLRLRCQGARFADQAVALTATQTYNLATMTGGPGSVVWHSYVGGVSATNLSWMERNPQFTIDGESTPSIQATGTEDWFDSAWYFNGWRDYNTSFHSYVGTDANSGSTTVVGMATDFLSKWGGVPFNSSCTYTLGTEAACNTGHTMAYAVLYYQ